MSRTTTPPLRPGGREPDASPEGFADRLNESDAILWNIERDPTLRTTIGGVVLLDRAPDWHRLRARVLEATQAVPRLRQRVVPVPLRISTPRWEDDESFDLDYHLRRVALVPGGDLDDVLEMATPIVMAAFDKARPLWEFTLVEGLKDGRAALILKLHHSFTDGVGGMRLARMLLDDRRSATRRRHVASAAPNGRGGGGPVAALLEAAAANSRTAMQLSGRAARLVPRLAAAAVSNPVGLAERSLRGARSIGKLLMPVTQPLSPVMRGRGLSRKLVVFDVPLSEALDAAHAVDGTLNDAFLAAVTGGMRHYHERHGARVDELRVTMPINLRRADDPLGNNRFTPARFRLPVGPASAAVRMRRLGALAREWRHEPALPLSEAIAGVLNRLPVVATTAIFGSMLKGIDFVATNVPGMPQRVYLAGAEVLRYYAFPPPSGSACGIALVSHGDTCCIGVTIDTAAVRDPDVLGECLRQGFEEVLKVGRRNVA
jgi:WS/DGAT/MGAT family acyltransferase